MGTEIVNVGHARAIEHRDNYAEPVVEVEVTGYDLADVESATFSTRAELLAFCEGMYAPQRASSTSEWDNLPPALADFYDAAYYAHLYGEAKRGSEAHADELAERQEDPRIEPAHDPL